MLKGWKIKVYFKPGSKLPLDHQYILCSYVHKIIGPNSWHDDNKQSLHRISTAFASNKNTYRINTREGFVELKKGSFFEISSLDMDFINFVTTKLERLTDTKINNNCSLTLDLGIDYPFGVKNKTLFRATSPILLKYTTFDNNRKHCVYNGAPEEKNLANELLKKSLVSKLSRASDLGFITKEQELKLYIFSRRE